MDKYKLVPVFPTEEMLEAGHYAMVDGYHPGGIYADMLAAAPSAHGPLSLSDEKILEIASNPMSTPCSPWWLKGDVKAGDVQNAAIAFAKAVLKAAAPWELWQVNYSVNFKGGNNHWQGGNVKVGDINMSQHLAEKFHPAWNRCSHGAKKLHGRNLNILLGADLDTPVDLVVCWTKDGKASGGTGQAMRAAEHFNIPIFNLYFDSTLDELEVFMNKLTGV